MELGFEFIGISGGKEDELRTGSWPLKGPPNEEINERDWYVANILLIECTSHYFIIN